MAKNKGHFGKDIVTPIGQLRFPQIAKPEAYKDGKPRYSATLVLQDGNTAREIIKAIDDLAVKAFGKEAATAHKAYKLGPDVAADIKEASAATIEFYKDKIQLSANSREDFPPVCVLANGNKMERRPGNENDLALIEEQFYPGALCRITATPYAYTMSKTNKGVTLIFKGIQFFADGQRLGGSDIGKAFASEFDTSSVDAFASYQDIDEEIDTGGVNI